MSAPFSESVLNRGPPSYDWKNGEDQPKYEGEIYQPPPLIKHLLGYVGYHMAVRPTYDENQRKYVPDEVARAWEDLTWGEYLRNTLFLQPGLPRVSRPFPWKDAYERSGFCPDVFVIREWKYPRRTDLHKYIPPPKDGVYEDLWHSRQHGAWVLKEWQVYRSETGIVAEELNACVNRHENNFNVACKGLSDTLYNMLAKTNVDKVRSLLWSGIPAVRDGGFKVRY
eukprot:TRINITY_DN5788_c0_g1_i1.p1 TRINITY_DN5788_c0_g1~~TRINITY_DN5788_c0_g1_i1.p1  ORF type:complete len:240 (+),score=38.72 TRINITY_DN5788_c0_g1_i1:47-721(+)